MNWLDTTVAEFGQQLGLRDLHPDAQGGVRLILASGRPLSLEPDMRHGHQELLVALGHPVGHDAEQHAQTALRMAHAHHFSPLEIQLAVSGHGVDTLLIATTRLPARALTAPALSGTVSTLERWLDDVTAAQETHG